YYSPLLKNTNGLFDLNNPLTLSCSPPLSSETKILSNRDSLQKEMSNWERQGTVSTEEMQRPFTCEKWK
ncbi:MAG TPA: hypothetical protein VN364_12700, partial [Bellilinea sp.]|nr:hypothetical protein [Bellilinea sp.]